MAMESFAKRFPAQGDRETLMMQITKQGIVPDGTYMVLDNYCTDPTCGAHHIMLAVLRVDKPSRKPMAVLSYEWEPKTPTRFELHVNDQPNLTGSHSLAFRDIIENHLHSTPAYGETLRNHFRLFRASLAQERTAFTGNRAQRRARS